MSPVLLLATLQVHPSRRGAQAKLTKNLGQKLTVRQLKYALDLSIYRECINLRQMLASHATKIKERAGPTHLMSAPCVASLKGAMLSVRC